MSAASGGGKKARKFYAVRNGRGGPGVFDTWPECESRVKGFAGAVHKSFATLQEAQAFAGVVASAVPVGAEQLLPHQEQQPHWQEHQPNKRFKPNSEDASNQVLGVRLPTTVVATHAVLVPTGQPVAQPSSREATDVERAMSDLEAALQERRQEQYGGYPQPTTAPAQLPLPQQHGSAYQHLYAPAAAPSWQQSQHTGQQQPAADRPLLPQDTTYRQGAGSNIVPAPTRPEQQGDEVSPEEAERRKQQSLAILPQVMQTAQQAVQGVTQPIDPSHSFMLHFDGASRGNPGIAGSGAVLVDSTTNQEVVRLVYPFSVRTTNNVAEWCALILGLAACKELGVRKLVCKGDSKLVINQLQNKWRVHKAWLQPLHEQGREIAGWFFEVGGKFEAEHVLRDQNKVADALSNIACDRATALLRR